jgi:hypothetical protein
MAATTVSAIIERIETVLAAAPMNLLLNPDPDPKADQGIPGSLVDTTFRVSHGGVVSIKGTSNFSEARIDRITVTVQKAMNFDGNEAQRAIQYLLDDVERAIIADGTDNDYMVNVEKGSRKTLKKKDSDVFESSIHFLCDYDFSEV